MISFIVLLFSLILENSWSLIFYKNSSLFLGLFSLVTIFSIYPLFNNNNKKYLITSFIYGLIYDIVFTNTLFLNALIFLLLAFIISKIYRNFSMNFLNVSVINICLIIIYRIINYLAIILINGFNFNYLLLLKSIYSSLIINIIYVLILNFIIKKICFKLNIKITKY